MSMCRYFARGKCRFGDRCRYVHSYGGNISGSETYNQSDGLLQYEPTQERYSRYDQYSSGKNQRHDSYDRHSQKQYYSANQNQRYYSSEGNNQKQRYESPDNYSRNQSYDSVTRHSDRKQYGSVERNGQTNFSYSYNQKQRNNSSNRYEQKQRNNSSNRYEQNQSYDSPDRYNQNFENTYGDNRFRWLSPDYKKEAHYRELCNAKSKADEPHLTTSTPKGKSSFSFKLPESEIRKESTSKRSNFIWKNEDQKNYAEFIKEEITAWEKGQQYPFSCFFPLPDKVGFPGFVDTSPEELRYEAYEAKANNTYDSYIKSVANSLLEVQRNWAMLKTVSPQMLDVIESVRKSKNFASSSANEKTFAGTRFFHQDHMQFNDSHFMNSNQSTATKKSSASTFSFVLPPENNTSKTFQASSLTEEDSSAYTPLDKLTPEEKHEFESSTFTLGKIPTNPPAYVMCF